ncbi:two-component system copper resistance phosphate regulon response regulator CusR [Nitrospirillum amazonense]|uniref:Two-component system copper resistance phosphate regulon response regulator CusR n=1 Tax=Nitrospirillum amazonense TaxID=28077 RepID=A0A560JWR0_9PROT|nr:winged helix-turn-helix domain-containing protein [Nitrospirillum amazonense]TWB75437.1 two-component system copper resistance phosphate regulon response regulator CusR [Nitrospirillum amazonense]
MRALIIGKASPGVARLSRLLRERGWQVDTLAALPPAPRMTDVVVLSDDTRQLRERLSRARRIFADALVVTLAAEQADRTGALALGADDQVDATLPGDLVVDRLLALLRLKRQGPRLAYVLDDLAVDVRQRRVRRAGRDILLSSREFQLLVLLLQAEGAVVPRSAILDRLWAGDLDVADNAVDALASRLRRRLDGPGQPRLLHTLRGVGYCLLSAVMETRAAA